MNATQRLISLSTLLLLHHIAQAAPGDLEQSPLYVGPAVESNIMILSDDSGSMDWEAMTIDWDNGGLFSGSQPDGDNPESAGAVKHRDSNDDGNANCGFNYLYGVEFGSNTYGDNADDCNTADDEAWRFRNSDFNPMYFNPAKTYKPWAGVDITGTPYDNIQITNAPDNPYDPGEWIDLTQHNSNWLGELFRTTSDRDNDNEPDGFRYYTWNDADSDGRFDNGEETEYKIKDRDADTQQNFANWFSYHRSREYVAKYALSQSLVGVTGVRVGYGTINSIDGVGIEIASMNIDPTVGNKRTLFNELFRTRSAGGTPLRRNLRDIGRYYECAANNFFGVSGADCPILPASEYGMCQKNFTIMLTDGFYNGGAPGVGNTDVDGTGDFDGGDYADAFNNTLGDVAMHYYERDLATSLNNEVPASGLDDAPHQHMTTYTVAFGVTGDKDPGDIKTPGNAADSDPSHADFNWSGIGTNARRVDDLWHAAFNGRGDFISAQNPDDMIAAVKSAVVSASKGASSASAVAFNSTTLDSGSTLYHAIFNPSDNWKGDLVATRIHPDGSLYSTPSWYAGAVLNAQSHSSRQIITYNPGTAMGTPFRTLTNLTTTQQADLNQGPSAVDANGQARLDYIRGDRSNESQNLGFRDRTNVLGDLVHSNPVFAGKVRGKYPDIAPFPATTGNLFSEYKAANVNRDGIVYVGSNDGMLHAFKESNGEEVFGYIPNAVFSANTQEGLHYLTDPAYTHRYYVDLSAEIADVYINSEWRTFLIGGFRAGGRGLFALDVTNPATLTAAETNAASIVQWEFTSADDADFGYPIGKPTIAKMANGRWAVITGNGYNSSNDGRAKLFIIYLDGGQDGTWTEGSDYIKIDTEFGSLTNLNGLSTPVVLDINNDKLADRVYAGDLFGNMWAFDLSDTATTAPDWKSAYKQGVNTPKPLFIAKDDSDNLQPITTKPTVTRQREVATSTSNEPNLMLFFGTGQYIVGADKTSTGTQTFYGVWDKGTKELDRSDLLEQVLDTASTSTSRIMTDNDISYGSLHSGWYFDLPTSGERVMLDAIASGSILIYATVIPGTQLCLPQGNSHLMFVNQSNGGQPDFVVFDRNNDGIIGDNDKIDGRSVSGVNYGKIIGSISTMGNNLFTTDEDGGVASDEIDTGISNDNGRVSWQEIAR